MKRRFLIIITAAVLALCAFVFTACGKEDESALRGTFTYQETVRVYITHSRQTDENDREHLYSNVYPLSSGSEGTAVAYNMDQSLKLNRDFTYRYDYTIQLSNPGDWGGQFARLAVSISGTFEFVDEGRGVYSVLLSNPTGGTQEVYGSTIGSTNIYNWSMHGSADLSLDYSTLSRKEGYKYDEYVKSRVVVVDKNSRSLSDDVFFPQIMNYIADYSIY